MKKFKETFWMIMLATVPFILCGILECRWLILVALIITFLAFIHLKDIEIEC